MKKNSLIILTLALISVTGCKKYLDVNENPNNPEDVPESNVLPAVETVIATQIVGGNVTFGVSPVTSYWTQQMALNQEQPQVDGYKVNTDGVDWFFLYPTLKNLQALKEKAVTNGNTAYAGIAEVLSAYTMGIITDLWGDVPYSQALAGIDIIQPTYDKQEDIYKGLQLQLDNAIGYFNDVKGLQPGADDFIYGGDIEKWLKFAYTLKARYYMHLTNAPGYTATTQADLALAALLKGFAGNDDDATFAYPGTSGNESPWYQNTLPGAGGVVLASTFIDSLVVRNDPRLAIMATKGTLNTYKGRIIGTSANPNPNEYSTINEFYAGADASVYIMTYAEALFLKAEASLIKEGATAATQSAYISGITAHMQKLGVDNAAIPVYIATRGALTNGNALQRIMEEKSIADFLSIENYNDWRRTGFPILTKVTNSFRPSIPVRLPYPLTSITSNPQPEQSAEFNTPVWWDN